jgi:hypothetical protein
MEVGDSDYYLTSAMELLSAGIEGVSMTPVAG